MRKLKTLLGIALTLVLLASLTVGLAAPAAADPGTLKFSNLVLPKVGPTGDYWAYPGFDVGAIDVAADGDTLFAASSRVPVELEQWGDETNTSVTWTTQKYTGSYSVELQAKADCGWTDAAGINIPVDIDPADLDEGDISAWFKVTEGNWAPYIQLVSASYSVNTDMPSATGFATWTEYTASETPQWQYDSTWTDWAGAQGHFSGEHITTVRIAVSKDSGDDAITAYVDGVTINSTTYDLEAAELLKSTDGGYGWKVTGFMDAWDEATDGSPIVDVTVSPDYEEDLTVFVATERFLYQSVDGGKRFVAMTPGWTDAETITDLDISLDERGRLAYMVGTSSVVPVEFEQWGDETHTSVTWTTQKYTGSYSVELQAKADCTWGDAVGINIPVDIDPTDLDEGDISAWFKVTEGNWAPYIQLVSASYSVNTDMPSATGFATWTEYTASETPQWQYDSTWTDWAGAQGHFSDEHITTVRIAVSKDSGDDAITAYVDDITIDGVTYYLEADGAHTYLGDVYVLSTATGMSWQAQGVGADVLAVGFSPFFADDEGISAVVSSSVATEVRFSFANTAEGGGWGDDIGDAGIHSAVGGNFPSSHARIAFPDDFDPWGVGNNICFVGIYAGSETAPADMLGDVYKVKLGGSSSAQDLDIRGVLTTLLPTQTNIVSIDVCGEAEEANILVGTDYCDLGAPGYYFLTYRSTDGGETWIPSGATKSPTGGTDIYGGAVFEDAWTQVLMSPDFLTDEIAYAATSGFGTSALSRTKDSGGTWDQIGLIDYGDVEEGYVIKDLDAAGYNAEGTLHMTTQTGGTHGAVWKRIGKNWERIWSYANPGTTNNIKVLIINGDETMFAVDYAAEKMWRSSNMGATWPKTINTKPNPTAVTVVSPTTIYTGHADGGIYWSTKSGTGWTKPEDNEALGIAIANIGVSGDFVLVGTEGGKVFISSDGGETVERVGLTNPGTAGPPTLATFGFATTDLIYATQVATPDAGVWRCEVNYADPGASEWVRIDDFQDIDPYDYTTVATNSPAIALPPSGVLYVVNGEAVIEEDADEEGGLWRCTNPTDPAPYPYFEKENKGLDTGDAVGLLDIDCFPTTIFCANGKVGVPYYNQVVMFTDTLDSGVPLAAPADGAAGVGTLYEGQWTADVVLAWEEMTGATKYQYQIAIDKKFLSVLPDSGFTAGKVASLTLSPNTTYYWRVRVAYEDDPKIGNPIGAPLISPWSEKWSFKTVIGPTVARPALEAPDAGASDVLLSPTFEWSGIEWAEKYEFELGTDPATKAGGYFAAPLVSLTGANALVSTAWKCDIDLDYETRYYWHVKAFGVDTETSWSDVGTFVTMAKPVVPPEPTPPVEIPPVQEITPAWIWAIVGIGAALVIAVIVLIVTTRRVP